MKIRVPVTLHYVTKSKKSYCWLICDIQFPTGYCDEQITISDCMFCKDIETKKALGQYQKSDQYLVLLTRADDISRNEIKGTLAAGRKKCLLSRISGPIGESHDMIYHQTCSTKKISLLSLNCSFDTRIPNPQESNILNSTGQLSRQLSFQLGSFLE